jgi:hypothetical protein
VPVRGPKTGDVFIIPKTDAAGDEMSIWRYEEHKEVEEYDKVAFDLE